MTSHPERNHRGETKQSVKTKHITCVPLFGQKSHCLMIWSWVLSLKFENFSDIMFLVAPPPSRPPPPPPHANACTGHNFVRNTPIKFIFAIAIEVPDYKNRMIFGINRKTKWPLAAILNKNVQKACDISNCVINSPINFIFGTHNGRTLLFLAQIGLPKWPLAAILIKFQQHKSCVLI